MLNFLNSFNYTNNQDFPNTKSKTSSGGAATDGTHFTVSFVDDIWGFMQALLTKAGLTPSGNVDVSGDSQIVEAVEKVALDYVTDNAGSDDFENQSGVAGVTISDALEYLDIASHGYTQVAVSYKGTSVNTDFYWSHNGQTLTGRFGLIRIDNFSGSDPAVTITRVSGDPLPPIGLAQLSTLMKLRVDAVFYDAVIADGSGTSYEIHYLKSDGSWDGNISAVAEVFLVQSAFSILA